MSEPKNEVKLPEPPKSLTLADLKKYDTDYVTPEAWKLYTAEELLWWVKLTVKKASLRVPGAKQKDDLANARVFLLMLRDTVKDFEKNTYRVLADNLESQLNAISGK